MIIRQCDCCGRTFKNEAEDRSMIILPANFIGRNIGIDAGVFHNTEFRALDMCSHCMTLVAYIFTKEHYINKVAEREE